MPCVGHLAGMQLYVGAPVIQTLHGVVVPPVVFVSQVVTLQQEQPQAAVTLSASHGRPGSMYWTVSGQRIRSQETKVASPVFFIQLPGEAPYPFQLVLYAEARSPKYGSAGFRRSRGRGRIELRSTSELPRGAGRLALSLGVGDGQLREPLRQAVPHDFSEQRCWGLRRMDFASAVDPRTGLLAVHLSVEPLAHAESLDSAASSPLQIEPLGTCSVGDAPCKCALGGA